MEFIHDRSGYDRGFISNPFAGDDAARMGLVRTERVLERLGRPDRAYPILHVAGSKGKGSTSTILASMLTASGKATGRFLSPHLHRFNERFAIDGESISDDELAQSVEQVRRAAIQVEQSWPEIGEVTAWELSTCIALLWFRDMRCGAVVLEVGMGGTLDATNVIQPAASLITRLDLEHTAVLGDTIEEIAANKAGIIKPGAPAFTVDQDGSALQVIKQVAAERGSPLAIAGWDWKAAGSSSDFTFSGFGLELEQLAVGLEGRHQVENAGLALATLGWLMGSGSPAWRVTEQAIRHGLAAAAIPGRFEVVQISDRVTVVIDGAHTPASMAMLAETVSAQFPDHRIDMIIGLLSDKTPETVLAPFVGVANGWTFTAPNSPRALSPSDLARAMERSGVAGIEADSVAAALRAATTSADEGPPRVIVVSGSLSTVAEAQTALASIADSSLDRKQ